MGSGRGVDSVERGTVTDEEFRWRIGEGDAAVLDADVLQYEGCTNVVMFYDHSCDAIVIDR